MVCKMCIFKFIRNEYHCVWKTIVLITLIIRIDISCDCLSVDTSGEFILSYLRYERWLQLVSVNIISFIYYWKLYFSQTFYNWQEKMPFCLCTCST